MVDDRSEESSASELQKAAQHRREADRALSMNERLAALHELCKQLEAVDGAARPR